MADKERGRRESERESESGWIEGGREACASAHLTVLGEQADGNRQRQAECRETNHAMNRQHKTRVLLQWREPNAQTPTKIHTLLPEHTPNSENHEHSSHYRY